jgi:hypothetical protein
MEVFLCAVAAMAGTAVHDRGEIKLHEQTPKGTLTVPRNKPH